MLNVAISLQKYFLATLNQAAFESIIKAIKSEWISIRDVEGKPFRVAERSRNGVRFDVYCRLTISGAVPGENFYFWIISQSMRISRHLNVLRLFSCYQLRAEMKHEIDVNHLGNDVKRAVHSNFIGNCSEYLGWKEIETR